MSDINAFALAALAADAGLPPETAWGYLNASVVEFDGLPPADLYAVRQEGVWRAGSAADLALYLPDHLCAYAEQARR